MQRLINRSQQGDLGEASAIEWFLRVGAVVSKPFGHSPEYDLVVDFGTEPLRVQVKTSTFEDRTPNGHARSVVQLATLGGNQSWSGKVKALDPGKVDLLFALTAHGRRWLIPTHELDCGTAIRLGGSKYAEFEISPGSPLLPIVFGPRESCSRLAIPSGERRSWRVGPACKVGALALSEFESHLPHSSGSELPRVPRGTRTEGQTRVSGNRQIVIPKRAFEAAGFQRGDRLKAKSEGDGVVRFTRIAHEGNANENGPPGGGPLQQSLDESD